MYRAIMMDGTVLEAATPQGLGTLIGAFIAQDARDDVMVSYNVVGPTSRRMVKED